MCFRTCPFNRCRSVTVFCNLNSTNNLAVFYSILNICLSAICCFCNFWMLTNQSFDTGFCDFESGINNIRNLFRIYWVICPNLCCEVFKLCFKTTCIVCCVSILLISRCCRCNMIFQKIGCRCLCIVVRSIFSTPSPTRICSMIFLTCRCIRVTFVPVEWTAQFISNCI